MSDSRIYFAPVDTPLTEVERVGTRVDNYVMPDGFIPMWEAASRTGDAFTKLADAFVGLEVTFETSPMSSTVHRLLFKWPASKRARKAFDRTHKQILKRERAEYRAGQRAAQGIKEKHE